MPGNSKVGCPYLKLENHCDLIPISSISNVVDAKKIKAKNETKKLMMLEREQELYSKICAASGIKDEASGKITRLTKNDKFSSSLATLLTRDKEVVANQKLPKKIPETAPISLEVTAFIKRNHALIDIKNMDKINIYDLSITCFEYYKNQREQYKDLENPATPAFIEYENFREACLNSNNKKDSLRRVYGKSMQLESADLKQTVKLHAEMNIMTNELINKEDKSRAFIAVSKK
ncbi:hypothetical protein RhiirC2_846665 [Rhizophagus irregularis]|uniref:Uncharacterized protein n=1 Tax=Rhizophagus irregularis TaxID=588596 RepID=A0A2N1NL89_9GLOM|nr:hypothetical protein RhiirC2_846665 [Rhizophagus irregularis]